MIRKKITGGAKSGGEEVKNSAEEEIDSAIEKSKVKAEKSKLMKLRLKVGGAIGGVVVVGALIFMLFLPAQGTMAFGLCKIFIELNSQYPQTIRLSTVEEVGLSVRIWFTQVDSFGEYRLEPMQCYFKQDDKLGFILDKVTINRREIDPEIIARFNTSIPVILQNPPDLSLPNALPDSLDSLQFQFEKFRKPIL